MKRVCAWCGEDMGDDGKGGKDVSHGICSSCSGFFLRNVSEPVMGVFLDRVSFPVLVVDDDVKVVDGNEAALRLVGKTKEEVAGFRGGELFECAYARLPGGCGKSDHCRGCVIRNSVTHTAMTGESVIDEPCHLRQHTVSGDKWRRYLVSTSRMGEVVLLKVTEAGEFAPTEALYESGRAR